MVNYLAIIAIKYYKYLIIIAAYNEFGYIYHNMLTSELPIKE
jgi:hypothetical protein